jgi:lipopolysaccharide transport system ATP-binding protein
MYQLGTFGTGAISRDLERYWARIRGKEDPFLKIGEENDRTVKSDSNIVWSLKDISFDIEQGDSVGIIGRNGAGKSTLLKVLSRITSPSKGTVKVKGRVASLLEVGTGFHPELSGRENIYLNGAVLGMRKEEIKKKFDEIVDFSGVERYIDTPVKRYSSGMYVRLAFAVAAHLESEILIVDEVLSVGDAEFQRKCLGKMGEVSKGEGRTVLFVSHNMGAIKTLCNNAVVLNNGTLAFKGTVNESLKMYTQLQTGEKSVHYKNDGPAAFIKQIDIEGDDSISKTEFSFDEQVNLKIALEITTANSNANIGIKVLDNLDIPIFTSEKKISELTGKTGLAQIKVTVPANILTPGEYKVAFALHTPNIHVFELVKDKMAFEILETGTNFYQFSGTDYGCVFVNCKWKC